MFGHPVSQATADDACGHIPLFDGFPYLSTRLVPAAYHLTLLPESWRRERLVDALVLQVAANQFQTALVLGPSDALYLSPGGSPEPSSFVPRSTIVLHGLLRPALPFDEAELGDRPERLVAFRVTTNGDQQFLFGDLHKGGRPATRDEHLRLRGIGRDGARRGLTRCERCGEWHGTCLDRVPGAPVLIVPVHCACDNVTRCARCLEPLRERRLNGNEYRERDRGVWHWPAFMASEHRCPACV
jgi:hypothetical protein